jgi:predicted aspartyl protease
MITGVVTADREPVIRLIVRGPDGEEEIEAVVDTGFNGHLTIPPNLIKALDLQWRRRGRALLADGTESLFDIYEANVLWDRQPRASPRMGPTWIAWSACRWCMDLS